MKNNIELDLGTIKATSESRKLIFLKKKQIGYDFSLKQMV